MRDWDFLLVPYSKSDRDLSVSLRVTRDQDLLRFTYRLAGADVADVRGVPGAGPLTAVRRDELWKTTCFEFFLGQSGQSSYFEINMNARGDWNAYAFTGYRAEMKIVGGLMKTPVQGVHSSDDSLELSGTLNLADFPLVGPVVLGATAVLEYQDGAKEYWALAHKGEKPDFHVRSSFIATV